jgi:hypothetical protein
MPTLSYATMDLFIYEGVIGTDKPVTAQYSLTKTELNDNDYVIFEISEFVKDFLITEYGNYATNAVWVEADITAYAADTSSLGTVSYDFIGVDGFGFFEDGINPQGSTQLLQDNTTIYYNDGNDIVIPIWAEDLSTITLQSDAGANINWEAAEDFWETDTGTWGYSITPITITDNGNSNQKIQYVIITDTELLSDGDTVTITSGVGGSTTVVTLNKVCEPKYTPLNVIFYNKYGALQNLWFFKRSDTTLTVQGDSYKRNIIDFTSTPTYNISKHQIKSFNVNGIEQIRLNTGFLPENFNTIIDQLLLSEAVWIDNGTNVLPVRPITDSITHKTSVNDKLISYALEFEYAYDKINNIR